MKEIIVLGDVELGGGTLTDDFISDNALARLIDDITEREHPVDLILNGDTFDFLKCPYIVNRKVSFPRHITANISLNKLRLIYTAHRKIFDALHSFVTRKKNRLFFIIGNHDPDIVFPEVQQEIRRLLGSEDKIHFSFYYRQENVHVEHGHQVDYLNKVDTKKLFLDYNGKKILNIPWLSLGVISNFLTLKQEHPFLERIQPRPILFAHHHAVARKLSWRTLKYFIKAGLYDPIRNFTDPTYWIPRDIFRELYRRYKDTHWDVSGVAQMFKRKRGLEEGMIYVLGHEHKKYLETERSYTIIHPDTWRDEYILDPNKRKLTPKKKNYVQIIIDDITTWNVIHYPIQREQLHFDAVLHDEYKALEIVAAEEGYVSLSHGVY